MRCHHNRAPEEVYEKPKKAIKGSSETTSEQRKSQRRSKKEKKKKEKVEKESEKKIQERLNPTPVNKQSKVRTNVINTAIIALRLMATPTLIRPRRFKTYRSRRTSRLSEETRSPPVVLGPNSQSEYITSVLRMERRWMRLISDVDKSLTICTDHQSSLPSYKKKLAVTPRRSEATRRTRYQRRNQSARPLASSSEEIGAIAIVIVTIENYCCLLIPYVTYKRLGHHLLHTNTNVGLVSMRSR